MSELRLRALTRSALPTLLILVSLRQARGQVCATEGLSNNLRGQAQVTLIVPNVPAANPIPPTVSGLLWDQANQWKSNCGLLGLENNTSTEGIPVFTTDSGTAFGAGQNLNNSILVIWNPGSAAPVNGGYPMASYNGQNGTLTLYGAVGSTQLDWTQPWVYQNIGHEIGHALGLGHDTCTTDSMMNPYTYPGLVRQLEPGECFLANHRNCVPSATTTCTDRDPTSPPIRNVNYHGLYVCQWAPELCPAGGNNPPWTLIWECIETTVTTSDCFDFSENGESNGCKKSDGGPLSPTTWTKSEVTCYPLYDKANWYSDPPALTDSASGPAGVILTPSDGQTVAGVIQITGAVKQGITGAGKIGFWLDGVAVNLANFTQGVAAPGACANPAVVSDPYCPNVGFTGSFDSRTVANGQHVLQAMALDRRTSYPAATYFERNFTTNNCSDITPPTVAVTSPANSASVSGLISVNVAASDNTSVSQASLYVDGQIVAVWNSPPYSYSWDTTKVTLGTHSLQARAVDGCGNTAASNTIYVNVTLVPLRGYIDAPAYNGNVSGSNFGMAGWASDPYKVTLVSFSLDGKGLPLTFYKYGVNRPDVCSVYPGDPNCPYVGWNANFDSTCFLNGAHTLTVTAWDGAGQTAAGNWPINVANTPAPSATMIWMQPEASAGYGPPGSLIVAGSAQGGSNCGGVQLWWRDVTAGSAWSVIGYAPLPDSNGSWINAIPNVNDFHQYAAYVVYSGATSATCNYPGTNSIHWCP